MARTAASFNRRKPFLKQEPKILVICEDSKSGKRYLEDASRHFKAKVYVEFVYYSKNSPRNIVNQAIKRQKDFDKVFCVIDRDTHETFDEALSLAKTITKIEVITSYPCFEFWLLLHFGCFRDPYYAFGKDSAADLVIKQLRNYSCLKNYDKGQDINIFNLMLDKFNMARQNSPKVLAEAKQTGEMNPSTQLHELIDEFEKLSKPQPIDSK